MGGLLVAAAASLWGLWPLWVRHGPGGAAAAAVAYTVAGLAGAPLAWREGRGRTRPARAWALLALLGVVDALNALLYFRALAEGAVAHGVLAHYLAPVLVALAAPRLLGEPRAARTPLALALALGGTAVLLFSTPGASASAAAARHAFLFGAASALFYAGSVLLSKRLASDFGDAELLAWHVLLGGLLVAAVSWPLGPPAELIWPAAGSVVSGLGAGLLYYAGLRRIAAERAAILSYLEPVAAVLCGWLAFGEAPGLGALAGGALVVAGGAIVIGRH
jgi:drug/metabolite transporter (DMT)-like permease